MDAMWTHDHSAHGVRLCEMCDRGTWIAGTRDGFAYLPHLGIEEERSVRTHCVDFVQPANAAPSYARACWERGPVPHEQLDQASELAGTLGLTLGAR